ncbi:hypothetical protein [Nocardia arthritidis]|uniref:DUF3558 domain-containing protein n=1 Tax=Nocardia arthritidis TaxID=228602 RepID=A0A6G9Y557_9NOCA|nr:hypothetical protein [Nocardia arthritidis]QIS08331.1 hypothetical protein F5544_02055 [Nocardia arthritidis]
MNRTTIAAVAVSLLPLLTAIGCTSTDSSPAAQPTSANQSTQSRPDAPLTPNAALTLMNLINQCGPLPDEKVDYLCTVDIAKPDSANPVVTVTYDVPKDDSIRAVRQQSTFTYDGKRWKPGAVEWSYRCNREGSSPDFINGLCP